MNERPFELTPMSPEALAWLGCEVVVYIKPVIEDGNLAYALHSASGQPLAIMASREEAVAAAIQSDLEPLSVH